MCHRPIVAGSESEETTLALNNSKRSHTLLLVEDNLADIKIAQRALEAIGANLDLLIARNGKRALKYLLRKGTFAPERASSPLHWKLPDLILLDLNLPGMTGLDVLGQIRTVKQLQSIPIIVLTTSPRPQDVMQAYAAGANSYFEKPRSFEKCIELMQLIRQYWLEMALLPES